MASNLDRFKKDLDRLVAKGNDLVVGWHYSCGSSRIEDYFAKQTKLAKTVAERKRLAEDRKRIESVSENLVAEYHRWYSEAHSLVAQLLPDRLEDFVSLYKKPKTRKELTAETYTIQDGLDGLRSTRLAEKIADKSDAIPKLVQQVAILASTGARFESSLLDIRTLTQADILDSELDAARELLKHKFGRAAGALCGVVIEKHLATVTANRSLPPGKKNPTIADLNDALKNGDIVDTATWRFVQHLADLRNLCVHSKGRDPKAEEVGDLIDGTAKIIKTIF